MPLNPVIRVHVTDFLELVRMFYTPSKVEAASVLCAPLSVGLYPAP